MTLIAPASIITAVCSSCRSMAGNDGARQNRTAKVPSQHDCTVIELRGAACPQHLQHRTYWRWQRAPLSCAEQQQRLYWQS
jgi:hypothetical protein